MSQIVEAIKRIVHSKKQSNHDNLPATLIAYHPPYKSLKNATPKNLEPKQLELVNKDLGSYQPRLSIEQIKEIVEPYRFQLPQEFYDLYLMGNGCLPIGISDDTDWNSVYNYFYFPDYPARFATLQKAMSCYCDMLINDNPRLLPFCTSYREDVVLSIVGSKKQQETSPVLVTYSDYVNEEDPCEMNVLFPSLTNMMLAYAELYEHKGKSTPTWIEDIVQKYGGNYRWFYY